jgi:hypothetical protein
MAMVPCRECDQSVSESAPTCPKCGVMSPGGKAQIEIKRVKRAQGKWVALTAWVDSEKLGDIGAGNSVTHTVTPGHHRVQCQLQGYEAASQEVEVPANGHLVVTVATNRWNGKPGFTAELT